MGKYRSRYLPVDRLPVSHPRKISAAEEGVSSCSVMRSFDFLVPADPATVQDANGAGPIKQIAYHHNRETHHMVISSPGRVRQSTDSAKGARFALRAGGRIADGFKLAAPPLHWTTALRSITGPPLLGRA